MEGGREERERGREKREEERKNIEGVPGCLNFMLKNQENPPFVGRSLCKSGLGLNFNRNGSQAS